MKTFTRADVLSWRPCYGEDETLRIMEGLPAEMTALDILRHEAATPADRLWCVIRTGVLSERTLRLFAAWCARTALDTMRAAGREPDPRSWAAVEIAERYAVGQATKDELRAVYAAYASADAAAVRVVYAAYAAADCTATDADFAYAAAFAAARAAAFAARAAAFAARAIATEAAVYAARAARAARAAQVARLIELIGEDEK